MSLSHEVTVWCDGKDDGCGQWQSASGSTAAELRKQLRQRGWTHKKGLDLCPLCSKEKNDER